MPTPRLSPAATASLDGRIFVIGGSTASVVQPLDVVEAYEPVTQTWATMSPMPTSRGFLGAATGDDGLIYAIGGMDSSARPLGTVEVYDPDADTWMESQPMPTARIAPATGLDGRIYSLGGTDAVSYFSSAETYDPESDAWNPISPMPTARGWFASAAGLDGLIYAVGGRTNGGSPPPPDPLPTIEVYDPQTDCW